MSCFCNFILPGFGNGFSFRFGELTNCFLFFYTFFRKIETERHAPFCYVVVLVVVRETFVSSKENLNLISNTCEYSVLTK